MGRLANIFRRFKRSARPTSSSQPLTGNNVIEIRGLTKVHGDRTILDGIDLDVRRGEILCLLGPNGVGKTAVLRLLSGLDAPTAGSVNVLGFNPVSERDQVERRVCFLSDTTHFQEKKTGREILLAVAHKLSPTSAKAEERVEAVLARTQLVGVAGERVATYSRGVRQRLAIAEALVKRAEILALDEPAMGLDPIVTEVLLQTIEDLKRENVTVVMASHLLDGVQGTCDRVAILKDARIVLIGTTTELIAAAPDIQNTLYLEAGDIDVASVIRGVEGVQKVLRERGGAWRVTADRDVRAAAAKQIMSRGGTLTRLTSAQPTLREVYAQYFQASPAP